jgi:hypothetical protein
MFMFSPNAEMNKKLRNMCTDVRNVGIFISE